MIELLNTGAYLVNGIDIIPDTEEGRAELKARTGAVPCPADAAKETIAYGILKEREMKLEDILTITSAIGQHDEETGTAVDAVSAALILADKTDVRRNRVQNPVPANFDIHDRVNYAALSSNLEIDPEKKVIHMRLELDDSICSVMDYFEIFLKRMLMCRRAAEMLGCRFKLTANGSKIC